MFGEPPPHAPPAQPGLRRVVLALGLFLLLALPSWPATVDDVYISIVYARQWAETGSLTWTTGERVEGYSNFLFVGLLSLAVRTGLDADLVAQLLSLACGAGIITLFARHLPRTAVGTLALLALASWAPLNRWSVIGMETTLYALLLTLGWKTLLTSHTGWGLGVGILAVASVTRPEGVLHFTAGLVAALVRGGSRDGAAPAGIALAFLVTYHAIRLAWFGELLPSSYLVKVSPIGLTPHGFLQLAGDLVTAAGLIAALAVAGRVPRRNLLWTLTPGAIQAATLVRASGDWMSWGRLTLPGVVASAVTFAALARWRDVRPSTLAVGAAVAIVASSFEPRGYGVIDLHPRSLLQVAKSFAHLRHGLDTPVAEDVRWVVDNVPANAKGLVVDAGILGGIPGFLLVDMRGLNHRPAAEAIAEGRAEEWLRATIADDNRPAFLRLANWDAETHPDYPSWLVEPYELRADLRYGGGSVRWYATSSARPSAAERMARWDELLRRHPSHPFLAWHAALSAAALGDAVRAERIAAAAHARWPSMEEFRDAPRSLTFVDGFRALAWRGAGFALRCGEWLDSRRIAPGEVLRLSNVGAPRDALLLVDDPCADTSLLAAPGTLLPVCAEGRAVRVTAECASGDLKIALAVP